MIKTKEELIEPIKLMEKIMAKLEILLRQSKLPAMDYEEALNDAARVYDFFSAHVDGLDEVQFSREERQKMVEFGVKFHNKSRNLSSNYLQLRAFTRASCAWIFAIFNDYNGKVASTVLKLLRKASDDFLQCEDFHHAETCQHAVHELWRSSSLDQKFNELSPTEIQELKISVFYCLLGTLKVLSSKKTLPNITEIKKIFAAIMELLPSLAAKQKANLMEYLMDIGYRLCEQAAYRSEALQFFSNAIELGNAAMKDASQPGTDAKQSEETLKIVKALKLRALLSQVFLFVEVSETAKAAATVNEIERLETTMVESINHTVTYAKLMISLKQNSLEAGESLLKILITHHSAPFKTILNGVKQYFNTAIECKHDITAKASDIYMALVKRFSRDPEYTTIRISHLQILLKAMHHVSDGSQFESRASEIAMRVMSDHIHQEHVLTSSDFDLFFNLIVEQVRQYQHKGQHELVKKWCEILIQLAQLSSHHKEFLAAGLTLKVEALLNLRLIAEATDVAQKAIQIDPSSTKIVIAYFKTLLLCEDVSEGDLMKRMDSVLKLSLASIEDKLQQISLFYGAVSLAEINKSRRVSLIIKLHCTWLKLYNQAKAWHKLRDTNMLDYSPYNTVINYLIATFVHSKVISEQLLFQAKPSAASSDENSNLSNPLSAPAMSNAMRNGTLTMSQIKEEIIPMLQMLLMTIQEANQENIPASSLGNLQDLLWLADVVAALAWVMADLLPKSHAPPEVTPDMFITTAKLFELAESLYVLTGEECLEKCVRCLLSAAAALLDAASQFADPVNNEESNDEMTISSLQTTKMTSSDIEQFAASARIYAAKAQELLFPQLEFADATHRSLYNGAVVLEIASYCRCGNPFESEQFLKAKQIQMLALDIDDIKTCIDIVENSKRVSVEGLRSLLEIAVKICIRSSPILPTTGMLYRRLLELSPTRSYSIEKIHEYEILLSNPINAVNVDVQDTDQIISIAYNSAVMLVDLDQIELAEKFVNKSLSLMKYSSPEMQQWLEKIQSLHATIVKLRVDASALLSYDSMPAEDFEPSKKRQATTLEANENDAKVGHLTIESFQQQISQEEATPRDD